MTHASLRETAQLTLNVNGVKTPTAVNRLVEIRGANQSVNIFKVSVKFQLMPRTWQLLQLRCCFGELKLKGKLILKLPDKCAAGGTQRIILSFTDLTLWNSSRQANAIVTLKHNDSILDTRELVLASGNRVEDLLAYFDHANDKGTVPSGIGSNERVEEVRSSPLLELI